MNRGSKIDDVSIDGNPFSHGVFTEERKRVQTPRDSVLENLDIATQRHCREVNTVVVEIVDEIVVELQTTNGADKRTIV